MTANKDHDAYEEAQEQQTFIHQQHQVPQYPATAMVLQPQAAVVVPAHQVTMAVALGCVYSTGYSKITSVCLGFLQIFICCLSIASAVVAMTFGASGSEDGTGIWCGIVYGIVGSIAVAAGFKPLNDLIIAAMVFSSVAIAFGITQLTLAIISLTYMVSCGDNLCLTDRPTAVISTVAMGTYGFWEIWFGLCLVIVGLRAVCCPPKTQTLVVPPPPPPPPPSVAVHLTSATVWDHSTAPGPSASASGYYEGFRLEEEEATASAGYDHLHPQSKSKN